MAVAGAVAGVAVAGPVVGAAAGGGGEAYAAARANNPVGDATRMWGEAAACASDKAGEVNDKHGIARKIAPIAISAMQKTKGSMRSTTLWQT